MVATAPRSLGGSPGDRSLDVPGPPASGLHSVVPIAFCVLLLVLVTTSQGGFAINRWAPLTLFVLALLSGVVLTRGRLAMRSVAVRASLCGIWGLAAWSLLSMLWATSSANALMGAAETTLYAAIVTLPFVLPLSRRHLASAGWALTIGIGAIAVYTTVGVLVRGPDVFLAGRLNDPVGYRNATALLFALPVWPCIVAAACRGFRRGLRAIAFSLSVDCLCLVFLTQSRGILLGLACGACVALLLGPDRVRRAWTALLALAAVAAASHWLLRPFHAFDGGAGIVSRHDITVAGWSTIAASAAALLVGMLIALFDSGLRANSSQMRHARQAARIALAAAVLAAVVMGAVAIGNPVSFAHREWRDFRNLNSGTPTTTRYASVSGQRYDLWRVAVREFQSAPLHGVGAQNYSFGYYRMRETNRNLNDPHSLLFAVLAEEGAVGIALLIAFLVGIGVVVARGWRRIGREHRRHAVGPLAAGATLLGQSMVDWMWLIPGLTAIGLLALAVGAAQCVPAQPTVTSRELVVRQRATARVAVVGRVMGIALLTVAVLAVLSVYLSNAYIQSARSENAHPAAELADARTASQLDPWSVTPHYLESSALETVGDRARARTQLLDALRLEPRNFATLGILGDFDLRGGDLAAARRYYRRALALDPLDTGLQQLVRTGCRGSGSCSS